MANKVVYLVRHPDKEGDAEGMYLGRSAKITAKGEGQANRLILRIMNMALPPQKVFCSTFHRAIQLAQRIAHDANIGGTIEFIPLFNEIDKPEFLVGMERRDPRHEGTMQSIRDQFNDGTVPEGLNVKNRAELEEQMRQILELFESCPEERLLVVGHAKNIAAIYHYVSRNGTLYNYYEETDLNLDLDTAGITTLKLKPNRRTGLMRWHIGGTNDVSHEEALIKDDVLRRLDELVPI